MLARGPGGVTFDTGEPASGLLESRENLHFTSPRMNHDVPEPAVTTAFDVVELFVGDDDGMLWLTLGFASLGEPLDVLHIVCGKTPTGILEEDALYLERTSQDLACSGEVLALALQGEGLVLALTPEGAGALELPEHVRFTFKAQPALFAQAVEMLAQMEAVGHACITVRERNE